MEIQIGRHTARVEDDILFLDLVRVFSLAEFEEYTRLAETLVAKYGYFFIADNISDLDSVPPEVRRAVAYWFKHNRCIGVAVIGGSIAARTTALFVVRVMTLLKIQTVPVVFLKTEQETRDWVAAQRRKRA